MLKLNLSIRMLFTHIHFVGKRMFFFSPCLSTFSLCIDVSLHFRSACQAFCDTFLLSCCALRHCCQHCQRCFRCFTIDPGKRIHLHTHTHTHTCAHIGSSLLFAQIVPMLVIAYLTMTLKFWLCIRPMFVYS